MPLTTWKSLSDETQSIWDSIDEAEKAKILAASRNDSKKPRRQVKLAEQVSSNETIIANSHESNVGEEEASDEEATTTIQANTALTTARNEAHPGDPRRMMGTNTPSKHAKEKGSKIQANKTHLEAMIHAHLDSDDDSSDDQEDFRDYWDGLDFQ